MLDTHPDTSRETSDETHHDTSPPTEAFPTEPPGPGTLPGVISDIRKGQPVARGVFAYFPKTLLALSECSRIGNEKHCPGEPLHWNRDASTDDADAAGRHFLDAMAYGPLTLNDDRVPHVIAFAWRALAFAERVLSGDDRWLRTACSSDKPDLNVPHSREFFEQMSTCREAYKRLALAFATVMVGARSVLDFGCGTGAQTAALARLGFAIVGVDPLVAPDQVEDGFLFFRDDPIKDADLIEGSDAFDVVICTEVAEHVYPERADALVSSICQRSRGRVIFSAARPGQEWEGHVNCQPLDYWIAKFAANGFELAETATSTLREAMIRNAAQHCGAVENFVVLDRTAGAAPAEGVH